MLVSWVKAGDFQDQALKHADRQSVCIGLGIGRRRRAQEAYLPRRAFSFLSQRAGILVST